MSKISTKAQPVYLRLFLDDPHIGCGYREFLVLQRARKWSVLLCISTMQRVRLPTEIFQDMRYDALSIKRTRLERRLRSNAVVYAASKGLLKRAVATVRSAS